ncbi:MAG: hypothetical protein WAT79_09290, partial [Saprospiraceae bacterium]
TFTTILQKNAQGFKFGFFSYQFSPDNFWLRINAQFTKNDGWFAGGGDQIHFIDRETFLAIGGYDEQFVIMEDFSFFRKIKKQKIAYCLINLPAKVSSRKYENNSYLKVNFTNLVAFILFSLKVPSVYIKNWCHIMLAKTKSI